MGYQAKILIVEDDFDLKKIMSDYFESKSYQVKLAATINEAYQKLSEEVYDLLILDINLPDGDGFELCRELRNISDVPIIFVSARTSEDDRIQGLDIGADDYLPKPFSLKELHSRINALLRRLERNNCATKKLIIGELSLDPSARNVIWQGEKLKLSPKEFDLLEFLMRNVGETLSKEKIITNVWGAYSEIELSTVSVHVRWLREKLEIDPSNPKIIQTVWGRGYIFNQEKT